MTFIEYACRQILGNPAGSSCKLWTCPTCEHDRPSLHLRLDCKDGKERVGCYRCREGGDVYDLLKAAHHGMHYETRRQVVARMQHDWQRLAQTATPDTVTPSRPSASASARPHVFPPRGVGRCEESVINPKLIEMAFADMQPEEWAVMARAVDIAKRHDVDVAALAWYCWHFARNKLETDELDRQQEEQDRQHREAVERCKRFIKPRLTAR